LPWQIDPHVADVVQRLSKSNTAAIRSDRQSVPHKGGSGTPDFRSFSPRFQEGNVEQNLALIEVLRKLADAKGVTVAQIAVAWVAHQGADIVPLVGARNRTGQGGKQ
jgi:aryl-alcohol dehydrogenase-like predicted oxidoreductase